MYVHWEKGTGPANSRTHAGKRSPLVFDADGNLVGHVVLSDIDDEDDDEDDDSYGDGPTPPDEEKEVSLEEALAGLAALVLAVVAASPHVKRWWDDHAVPGMQTARRSVRDRLARVRRRRGDRAAEPASERPAIPLPPVQVPVPEEERPWLSGDEAQQRLLVALAARAFSDEQLRILLRARVGETDRDAGLNQVLAQGIPPEVEEQVTLMIETNPGLLDDFARLFWSERAGDDRAPISRSRHPELPRRPLGE